jgi:hypothetical protein
MSLFAGPTANIGLARVMCNYLLQQAESVEAEALLRALSPPEREEYVDAAGNALVETLEILVELGIASMADHVVQLTGNAPQQPMAPLGFRRLLQVRLADIATSDDLLANSAGGRDLLRGAAWMLAQDPLQPVIQFSQVEPAQDLQVGFDARPIPLVEQWRPFARWATSIGYLSSVGHRPGRAIVADPTLALADVLQDLEPGSRSGSGFVDLMAETVPVVDRGSAFEAMRARYVETPPGLREEAISASLSLAILRLIETAQIRVEDPHDAPPEDRVTVIFGGTTRMVGRVSWGN